MWGCSFLLFDLRSNWKWKEISHQPCPTLWPWGRLCSFPPGLRPWNFSRQEFCPGCYFLSSIPNPGIRNPDHRHCRKTLLNWATRAKPMVEVMKIRRLLLQEVLACTVALSALTLQQDSATTTHAPSGDSWHHGKFCTGALQRSLLLSRFCAQGSISYPPRVCFPSPGYSSAAREDESSPEDCRPPVCCTQSSCPYSPLLTLNLHMRHC